MSESLHSREDWEQLRMDPDLESDLGYEPREWEVLSIQSGSENQTLFLPDDEDDLHEDTFIVADEMAVCNVHDCR